jgi:competence protein ComEA
MKLPRTLLLAILLLVPAILPIQVHPQTPTPTTATAKLDLNTATPTQLKTLPGLGDAYIQRIIAGRPYTAKNQLTTRGILPQPAYDKIKDLIIAHRPATK